VSSADERQQAVAALRGKYRDVLPEEAATPAAAAAAWWRRGTAARAR